MKSIDKEYQAIYEINKSKFISYAFPVFTEVDCNKHLERLRKEYSDATHICYAYTISNPRLEKCSDDGEPSGTAGKPLIALLKKKELDNILLVVIRYFGGIKLGAGGLVRAYTTSGGMALTDINIVEMIECKKYKCVLTFAELEKFKSQINALGGKITDTKFLDYVELEFLIQDINSLGGYNIVEIGSEVICL